MPSLPPLHDHAAEERILTLLAISVVPDSDRWSTVPSSLARSHTDDVSVDSTRDTVCELDVKLGKGVLLVDTGVGQVTDSSSLDDVPDSESLDGLVLGDCSRAVGASDESNVASAVLVATAVLWERGQRVVCEHGCAQ